MGTNKEAMDLDETGNGSLLGKLLERARGVFHACADRATAGPHWKLRLSVVLTVLSLVVATPSFTSFHGEKENYQWGVLEQQIAAPFTPMHFEPGSHQSKIGLRLTVPLIAHVLHLDRYGCVALMLVALFGLFHFLVRLSAELLQERRQVFTLAASFCFMFVGNVLVSDMRALFDVVAFCCLAGAMQRSNGPAMFAWLLLAYFTDERALIASPLVLIWAVARGQGTFALKGLSRSWPVVAWVVSSWIVCLGLRAGLEQRYGLRVADGGTHELVAQLNNLCFGAWTGLEGLWLPVLAGVAVLWLAGQRVAAVLSVLSLGAVLVVAFSVIDITRSVAYGFPMIFIGLLALQRSEPPAVMHRVVKYAFLLCLFPTYYTDGKGLILYYYPLPFRLLGIFLN